jgi:hypothetical protein
MAWIDLGSGRHKCPDHEHIFELPDSCPGCMPGTAPAVEDEIDALPIAPQGCDTTLEHERDFTMLARDLEYAARQFIAKDVRDQSSVKEIKDLAEVALRARRAAAELAEKRERRDRVNAREKRIRDRHRRQGASN